MSFDIVQQNPLKRNFKTAPKSGFKQYSNINIYWQRGSGAQTGTLQEHKSHKVVQRLTPEQYFTIDSSPQSES